MVCQSRETGKVHVLQDRVVDGTECDAPDRLGICLGGVCQVLPSFPTWLLFAPFFHM